MIKVLDLFAGTQSVRKALDDMGIEYEYIGIDIYSPEQPNTILDLAQDNIVEKLVEVLPKDWKPDFIWASPICNKFSLATTGPNGNTYFVIENDTIRPRKENEYQFVNHNKVNTKPDKWEGYVADANFALKMFENTKKIITHFNAPFAIENPRTALSKYILKEYKHNYVNYCMYSEVFSKKPTTIYTNKAIDIKLCNHKGRHNVSIEGDIGYGKGRGSYANRSSVPPLLIKEIISQLMKGGK